MAFHEYHFLTHWRVKGAMAEVYSILRDGRVYCRWWGSAYLRSDEVGPHKIQAVVRSRLPYLLTFTTEIISESPPHQIELKAAGDLVGKGRWQFRQTREWTEVDFYWDVHAQKPLLRWLSPLLRPLFKWNHDWVMREGEKGLQKRLVTYS